MPDVAVHAVFGREVLAALDRGIAEKILEVPYTFALFGPDVWFMYQPWKRREGRGRRMHTTRTGQFLTALARQAKNGRHPREMCGNPSLYYSYHRGTEQNSPGPYGL